VITLISVAGGKQVGSRAPERRPWRCINTLHSDI